MTRHKLLGIPAVIWGLQLLYVALAMSLLAVLYIKFPKQVNQLPFRAVYIIATVTINIVWRVAIKKLNLEWF